MNKTLLKQLIREELKNVREQMGMALQDPTQAIEKMADRLEMRVNVSISGGYNKLEFLQKQDVDEKTFEMFIKLIEKLGYNVDLGRSDREYEREFDNDRIYYPQIRF